MLTRRDFMRAAGASCLLGFTPARAEALMRADLVFASSAMRTDGSFALVLFNERGEKLQDIALPARGHDAVQCPVTGKVVAFARRPGTFAVVCDPLDGSTQTITAIEGRHFYGHGVFSADGKLLYATENDFENAAGMVGIYDTTDTFRRIGEWPTHGVGPHDILRLSGGDVLCVANGGIETHPDFGRTKLNLPTMEPSLVFLDARSGHLIAKQGLPPEMHKLSLRHLAIGAGDDVFFAAQDQEDRENPLPLAGRISLADGLTWLPLPPSALAKLKAYVGSIATNDAGQIALTSPVGNVVMVVDRTGAVLAERALDAVCGVAGMGAGFALTTGLNRFSSDGGQSVHDFGQGIGGFDNHLLNLS